MACTPRGPLPIIPPMFGLYDTVIPMKLVSINIEWNKHLDTVLPFIRTEVPDVLCLQEVDFSNLKDFEALGYASTFLPYTLDRFAESSGEFGIALLTKIESLQVTDKQT
jgi:exonuclease III